jgi:hypothetical protein
VTATYNGLSEWARNRRILCLAGANGRQLAINGIVSVEFRETAPRVVVEWGDGYRGDFSRGLPLGALTGLVAGFLGMEADRG